MQKQWTRQECEDLVQTTMAQYGIVGVEFYTRDRQGAGVCRTSRRVGADGLLPKKKIGMANHLWTGQLRHRGRLLVCDTSPEKRLWTLLHEMAHMVLACFELEVGADVGRESPHGRNFQKMETGLCMEFGWKPIYVRCPGYCTRHKNIETGKVLKTNCNWRLKQAKNLDEQIERARNIAKQAIIYAQYNGRLTIAKTLMEEATEKYKIVELFSDDVRIQAATEILYYEAKV